MPGVDGPKTVMAVLDRAGLDGLIAALLRRGIRVIGPTLVDDAVVYDEIASVADFPQGIGDDQDGGHYRLRPRADRALFGYTVAPQGWKKFLHPPRQKVFTARRADHGFEILPSEPAAQPMAFLGVRACELAAINVQATVFGDPINGDVGYRQRLAEALIIAVECGEAGGTCFCASMGTGPEVRAGFDIRLIELAEGDRHIFLADTGSAKGAEILNELQAPLASEADTTKVRRRAAKVSEHMGRSMQTATAQRLGELAEHARWADVGKRCLSCGNCTMVCPTCFCTTVEDVTDLRGEHAERWRSWDSCFSVDFSYIHGGAIRNQTASRYRQWITHKLSAWHQQFGTSGCVGCGRCITWCPVGIDITEEVQAIHTGGNGR